MYVNNYYYYYYSLPIIEKVITIFNLRKKLAEQEKKAGINLTKKYSNFQLN